MSSKFGKYRLIAELGHGGMADVFLAAYQGSVESQGFSKLLVVKRLRANLADEQEFVSMLLDEGRLAARLNHPNVVQTYEIGEAEGRYFIAMEYLDGQPLHRILNRAKSKNLPLSMGMGLTFLVDVLAGLHSAHELLDFDGTPLGVVHRDISPQNVFVSYAGQIKVVDFGIAKAMGRSAETREGVIKGKITYMAPEQVKGSKEIDRRSDVFAVGVMLWEIVTGERLWKGQQDVDIVQKLLSGDYPRNPRQVKPEIPEELDRICAKSLEPKKDERYATALEFQNDLEAFLRSSNQMVTGREIGKYISDLFADKQAEVKRVIEAQLKRIAAEPKDQPAELATAPVSVNTGENTKTADGAVVGASSETMVGTVSGPLGQKKKSKTGVFLVVGGAIAAVAVFAFARNGQPPPKATTETTTTTPSAPQQAPRITIVLKAQPSEAQISIDDGPPLQNPYVSDAPRDGSNHTVIVRAPGYKERAHSISYSRDVTVDTILEREPQKAATAGPQRPPAQTGGGRDEMKKKQRGLDPITF